MNLLSFVIATLLVSSNGDYLSETKKFSKKFAELTTAGVETLKAMKNLKKTAGALMRLGGPVSAVVAAGIDIVFDPDSDELKAIKQLDVTIKEGFRNITALIVRLEHAHRVDIFDLDYKNSITVPLDEMKLYLGKITLDRPKERKRVLPIFQDQCLKFPDKIYVQMKVFLRPCKVPEKEEFSNSIKIQDAFNRLESRMGDIISEFQNYQDMKHAVRRRAPTEDDNAINRIVDAIDSLSANSAKQLQQRLNTVLSLDDMMSNVTYPTCIFKELLELNQYDRTEMFAQVDLIRSDLATLAGLVGVCANVSKNGDPDEMKSYMNETEVRIEEIVDFIIKWTEANMDLQWPNAHISAASNELPNPIKTPFYENTKFARLVQNKLNNIGNPKYYTQVILLEKDSDLDTFALPINSTASYVKFEKGSFVGYIMRLRRHRQKREKVLQKWVHENDETLHKHAWQYIKFKSENYLPIMDAEFNLIAKKRWSVAVQARTTTILCTNSVVLRFGLATRNVSSYPTTSEIYSEKNEWPTCYITRIFLFI